MPEYIKKLPTKYKQETGIWNLYLKNYGELRVTFEIIWEFIQVSSKEVRFNHPLLTWGHGEGLSLLQPLAVPAAHNVQYVNDELGNTSNLHFVVYFFWKMSRKFRKTAVFYFRAKEMLWLNRFSDRIPWKIASKKQAKNATLNIYTSKTRANPESKLKLPKIEFHFFQNSFGSCKLFSSGYRTGGSNPL